ncbi:MAG: replicative DNA helicase [Clostridia bacterium]|nr:replicative DNA helicase [Clostridia bacterium]
MAHTDDLNLNMIPGMPYSLEAEQAVLGCALLDEGCLNTVIMQLRGDAFYNPLHQKIYEKIREMVDNGKRPDLITVLTALNGEVDMATEELREYLLRICQIVPILSGLNAYIKIVQDKYYLRKLYAISKETIDGVMSGTAEADMILERTEQQIYDIRQGREIRGPMEIKKVLTAFYDELNELAKLERGGMRGIPSGYGKLDKMLSGLNRSDLIILAARPGVGKTSFALNIAVNVAKSQKINDGAVCVFSLEMSSVQLVERLLAAEGCIEMGHIINGNIDADESVRIAAASGELSGTRFYIDDTSNITVSEIKARLRKIKNLRLVIIDYLQLISSGRRGNENRTTEVSEMTRALKIMAKELNVPVIVLSQLSRDSVKVGAKTGEKARKPELTDLRESGSIEQDADIVMFLHFERDENAPDGKSNKCELLVRKNRHGPAGSAWLLWQGQFTKFSPLDDYEPEQE